MTSKKTNNDNMNIADNFLMFPLIDTSKLILKKQLPKKIFSYNKKPKKKLCLGFGRTKSANNSAKIIRIMDLNKNQPSHVRTPPHQFKRKIVPFSANFRIIKSLGNSPINKLFSIENSYTSNKNLIFKKSRQSLFSRRSKLLFLEISKLRKKIKKKPRNKIVSPFLKQNDQNKNVYQTPEKKLKSEKEKWELLEEKHKLRKKNNEKVTSKRKQEELKTKQKSNSFEFTLDFLNSDVLETLKKAKPFLNPRNTSKKEHSAILNQNVVTYKNNFNLMTLDSPNAPFDLCFPAKLGYSQMNATSHFRPVRRTKGATNGSESTFVLTGPKKLKVFDMEKPKE